MTVDEQFVESLVPHAAELVGVVRDYGPEDVAQVLARIPDGKHDALCVVLAAMVDPDKTPRQLLGWLDTPVQSRSFEPQSQRSAGRPRFPREHGSERGYQQHRNRREMPPCEPCAKAHRDNNRKGGNA